MGQINVKGLGVVNIEGDKPTSDEAAKIKDALTEINNNLVGNSVADEATEKYTQSPSFGRILTEAGLSIVGALGTGAKYLPGIAGRVGMLSKPFINRLLKTSAGSAVGGGSGAIIAQTFDPKDNVVNEVIRAATEGAAAEIIGAPIVIKGGQYMSKILGKPEGYAKLLDGAEQAESTLRMKANEILYGKEAAKFIAKTTDGAIRPIKEQVELQGKKAIDDEAIKDFMKKNDIPESQFQNLKDKALEMQKGLTPGVKTENRTINIIENIVSKALFGGGALERRRGSAQAMGKLVSDDIVNSFQQVTMNGQKIVDKEQLGNFFFKTITDAENMFRAAKDAMYKRVDDALISASGKNTKFLPTIPIEGKGSLQDIVQQLQRQANLGLAELDPLTPFLGSLARKLDNAVIESGGKLAYAQLGKLRSQAAALKQQFIQSGNTDGIGGISRIVNKMDELVSPESLTRSGLSPQAGKFLQEANEFYEGGMDIFQRGSLNAVLAKGIKANGDIGDIFAAVFKTGDKSDLVGKVVAQINELPKFTKYTDESGVLRGITTKQADDLLTTFKGQFINQALEASKTIDPQFGNLIDAKKFAARLEKQSLSMKKIFNKDELKKVNNMIETLAFAQGDLTRMKGLPGGVFIQLKQAGAAGQLLQLGGAGFGLATGNILPAVTVLATPFFLAKGLLNPKFQKLIFDSYKAPSAPKSAAAMRQLIGRMFSDGYIVEEERDKSLAQLDLYEEALKEGGVPLPTVDETSLPEINQSNFPVINQTPITGTTAGSNPELAQALNLFNKGGIVNAKKVNA
tara:strand:- start:685 stop:3081 length:2397 start_codon:yes stop_codon:yes gene_type:complete